MPRTEPADEALLAVDDLETGYGDITVLWGITLSVAVREIVCIVGSNGAGKSTFLRCVSGLLAAKRGRIRLNGRDIERASPAQVLAAGVAHVPEGRRLFQAMSVRDNLLMGAYLRADGAEVARDLERVYEIFPILAERRRQDAGTLSGGEQQMCAIGRGLMSRPRLLMIDELSLGLAPRAVELLTESLLKVNREGVAILLVEQDVMNALELADRAYVFDRGRVAKTGMAQEMATDPAIREAYMGAL
jgi:branched-chain amino acid transport system ATP-binding protein